MTRNEASQTQTTALRAFGRVLASLLFSTLGHIAVIAGVLALLYSLVHFVTIGLDWLTWNQYYRHYDSESFVFWESFLMDGPLGIPGVVHHIILLASGAAWAFVVFGLIVPSIYEWFHSRINEEMGLSSDDVSTSGCSNANCRCAQHLGEIFVASKGLWTHQCCTYSACTCDDHAANDETYYPQQGCWMSEEEVDESTHYSHAHASTQTPISTYEYGAAPRPLY